MASSAGDPASHSARGFGRTDLLIFAGGAALATAAAEILGAGGIAGDLFELRSTR